MYTDDEIYLLADNVPGTTKITYSFDAVTQIVDEYGNITTNYDNISHETD